MYKFFLTPKVDVDFFCLNMCGFNKARKHEAVKQWVQQVKSVFGCLLETRVPPGECSIVLSSCLPGWRIITNYDHHPLCRIWFCWSDGVEVTLLFRSAQTVTCAVRIPQSGLCFMVSVVYAFNTEIDQRLLWDDIRATQAAYCHLLMPWMLIGDYNEILTSS